MNAAEKGRAKRFAEAAFRAMAAHDVAPTPQNYALWYAYASGAMPELKEAIDALIAKKTAFTAEVTADLYQRYFDAVGHFNLLQETGGKLHYVVDQVRKLLDSAAGQTNNFGHTLDEFNTAIGKDAGGESVRTLLADLVHETQEMAGRNKALEDKLNRASGEVTQLRENLEIVQREALTDGLTGIPNRKFFETRLREAARDAIDNDEPLSLLITDIDHFKRFNDTYGHQVGDQVLRLVARTLSDSVKGRDTPARYGGEEFAIILPQTRLKDARVVAEQIRNNLTRRKIVGKDSRDEYGTVTLSFGAGQYRPGERLSDLIERADAALYLAKRTGRNRVATEDMVPQPVEAPAK
jgi:diguanylate cyclase